MAGQRSSDSGDRSALDERKVNEHAGSWGNFFSTVGRLLFQPATAWEELSSTKEPIGKVLWPHVLVLLGARGVAEFLGNLLQGNSFALSIGQLASSILSWFVLIWLFAVAAGSIASAREGDPPVQDSFRFSVYALTPLFVIGMLAVIPVPYVSKVADLLLMPYAFYVLAVGVVPMLRIPLERSPGGIGLLTGTLVLLWALIPTLLTEVLKMLQK